MRAATAATMALLGERGLVPTPERASGRYGIPLREMALAIALGEAAYQVREKRANHSDRIAEYWRSLDPPLDIDKMKSPPPWCATFIQFVADAAARVQGRNNPLDAVPLEAYVQSYVDWARREKRLIGPEHVEPGDLVAFRFGDTKRWNHIGMVALTPAETDGLSISTVEGNTPPSAKGDQRGAGAKPVDGVYRKPRRIIPGRILFIRWDTAPPNAEAAA